MFVEGCRGGTTPAAPAAPVYDASRTAAPSKVLAPRRYVVILVRHPHLVDLSPSRQWAYTRALLASSDVFPMTHLRYAAVFTWSLEMWPCCGLREVLWRGGVAPSRRRR